MSKVNGDRYRALLNKFLFTEIEEEDIGSTWFQQAGAACHTAEATLNFLRPVFEDRIISRRADVVRPPRSCNLTETIDTLKDNIREATGYCMRGSHLNKIIFHY